MKKRGKKVFLKLSSGIFLLGWLLFFFFFYFRGEEERETIEKITSQIKASLPEVKVKEEYYQIKKGKLKGVLEIEISSQVSLWKYEESLRRILKDCQVPRGRIYKKIYPQEKKRVLRCEVKKREKVIYEVLFWQVIKPRVCIIIDDLGYGGRRTDQLLEMGLPVSVSVLPALPQSKEIAEKFFKAGFEILLHLPLAPLDAEINPGPAAIHPALSLTEVRRIVQRHLHSLPHLIGVNNHMGSKIMAIPSIMKVILEEIKKEDLIFIDSLTVPQSQNKSFSEKLKLNFIARDVFLDNFDQPDYIRQQFRQLVKVAQKKGQAIGIGHIFRKHTLPVLAELIPFYQKKGIDFIFVSALYFNPEEI
jgi:hypothetical protein